jgi:hypothetical protein
VLSVSRVRSNSMVSGSGALVVFQVGLGPGGESVDKFRVTAGGRGAHGGPYEAQVEGVEVEANLGVRQPLVRSPSTNGGVGMYAAIAEPTHHLSWNNTGLLFGGIALYLVSFGFWRWAIFHELAGTRLVAAALVLLCPVAPTCRPVVALLPGTAPGKPRSGTVVRRVEPAVRAIASAPDHPICGPA